MRIGQDRAAAWTAMAVSLASALVLAACSTAVLMPGGPFTQAQLISGLEAHGYRDVALGDQVATPTQPHPEALTGVRSADDPQARTTPVHLGWNGRAVKDGRAVNIYVKAEAPPSLPRDSASAASDQELTIYLDRVAERTVEERTQGAYLDPRIPPASPPPQTAASGGDRTAPASATPGAETISSDIALRLAEMVFIHNYGREITEAQSPLSIADRGDRWEIRGKTAASLPAGAKEPSDGRLSITIMKADARIVELVR
jgi:hypothetical protein